MLKDAFKTSGYKVYRTFKREEEQKEEEPTEKTIEQQYEEDIRKANEIIKKKMEAAA